MTTPNPLVGYKVRVAVPALPSISEGQQALLRTKYGDGDGLPAALRHRCHVAQSVKRALGAGLQYEGVTYELNQSVSPQFGKDSKGKLYLTFGLIGSDGSRSTFKWLGDAVPKKWLRVAMGHDMGIRTANASLDLDFSTAIVWETNSRRGRGAGRHDVSPTTGELYPRKPQSKLNGKRAAAHRYDRGGSCDL